MQQHQQIMIVMLLLVVALMMSRDTHKLFAETTRTWAQFGSSNYKAISALTTIAMFAIGTGVWKNQQDIKDIFLKGRLIREKQVTRDPIGKPIEKRQVDLQGVTTTTRPTQPNKKKRPKKEEFLAKYSGVDETHRHFEKIREYNFKKKLTDISNNPAYDDSYDDYDENQLIQQRPITYASPGLDEQALH